MAHKLTVVIVSYNVKYYLEQCLVSLRRALTGIDAEVYVVDNDSKDDSIGYLAPRFPEVKMIASRHNLGFARANNLAIRSSESEYVLLLNPDTIVGEESIRQSIAFMDAHPKAGAAGVRMLRTDGSDAKESRRGLPTPLTSFYKISGLCERFPNSRRLGRYYMSYLPWDEPNPIEVISGAYCFLRRKALDEVGLLDEDFFMYGEDIDLSYRVLKGGYENWYLNFLEWCKQNDCIPDSLSFTYYDTKLISNKNHSKESFGFIYAMSLSESPDGLKDFVMQVLRERRRLNLGKLPIYLSEWNNTPSQQDLLNDTCFKSCYIVKNILENYDRLESFTYQALTDLMADSSLPNMLFFGGLGLFTVNGIPKASYYAYTLLQQLGDQFLGRGDEYFITRENDSFQVMLYNYRHFNYLYANGERFDMTETDRYTVFADSEPVMISLCLSDIPQGNYKISETYVNRTHGSAFDQWVSMGALELTTPQEIDWLKKSSVPGFHQKIVSVNSDEILELDVTLELLEVRLIQITPLH